jgi:hypothetical protein
MSGHLHDCILGRLYVGIYGRGIIYIAFGTSKKQCMQRLGVNMKFNVLSLAWSDQMGEGLYAVIHPSDQTIIESYRRMWVRCSHGHL